jgi:hypothetical protein
MPRQRKDGKRRPRVVHLLLAAAALGNGGCLIAAAGAAAGGATAYYYFKGKVCQEFPATFHDTWLATQTALQGLQMPLVSNENDGRTGKLTSRTADETSITIDLEVIPSRIPAEGSLTRVCVRVGTFGDEAVSRRLLEQISTHLAPAHLVPVPAPSAGAAPPAWAPSSGPPPGPVRPTTAETKPPPELPPEPVPVGKKKP